jgi:hypothetical protein
MKKQKSRKTMQNELSMKADEFDQIMRRALSVAPQHSPKKRKRDIGKKVQK